MMEVLISGVVARLPLFEAPAPGHRSNHYRLEDGSVGFRKIGLVVGGFLPIADVKIDFALDTLVKTLADTPHECC